MKKGDAPLVGNHPSPAAPGGKETFDEPPEYLEPLSDISHPPDMVQKPNQCKPTEKTEAGHQNQVEIQKDESSISRKWRRFVDEVARSANVSLVSLLRNAVVLELNEQHLVIGYQNIQLFNEEKRIQIENIAKTFFNDTIRVIYRESRDGLDDSLKTKHDIARAKEEAEIRENARNDKKVIEILEAFPNAEITDVTILENKTE